MVVVEIPMACQPASRVTSCGLVFTPWESFAETDRMFVPSQRGAACRTSFQVIDPSDVCDGPVIITNEPGLVSSHHQTSLPIQKSFPIIFPEYTTVLRYFTTERHVSTWRDQNDFPSQTNSRLNRSGSSRHFLSSLVLSLKIDSFILGLHR